MQKKAIPNMRHREPHPCRDHHHTFQKRPKITHWPTLVSQAAKPLTKVAGTRLVSIPHPQLGRSNMAEGAVSFPQEYFKIVDSGRN